MTREKKEDLKYEARMQEAWARGFMEGTVARIEILRATEERRRKNAKARLKTQEVDELQPA
jgi:hypothetical protein